LNVRLARIAVVGVIVAALSGCIATSTAGSRGPSATDPVINSVLLTGLSAGQICSLLHATEATVLLGYALKEAPTGMSAGGEAADCIYQDATVVAAGTYIKVEINRIGFAGQAILVNLHRSAHTLEVGGFEAIGAEAEEYPVIDEAVLCVRLAKEAQDPALWIEAPTSAIAEGAAGLILPRLAALR
jgi:hypothetical protein